MKILGLGDNVFDVYENKGLAYPGGNAVNVAVNAARLGADAAYLGNVGTDAKGDLMLQVLAAEGVDAAHCPRPAHSTTKCCIEDVIDGERQWKRNDLGLAWAGPLVLTPALVAYALGFDAILTSCNAKMPEAMSQLVDAPGIVVFDFGEKEKYRTYEYLSQVVRAIDIAQLSMSGATREGALADVARMGLDCAVLITRGEAAPLFKVGDTVFEGIPAMGRAMDTMGAGDAFITALVYALFEGGWRKGAPMEPELVRSALDAAAHHAGAACAQEGGFGHPFQLVGDEFQAVVERVA